MSEPLTDADLDFLLEALNSHKASGSQGDLMGDMMLAVTARSQEHYREMQASSRRQREDRRREQKLLEERVILLQAKLIQMKTDRAAERLTAGD